ncbi:FecCD family ABC transporter permease [Pendulispora albinea]|uniref:Iron ABC transporter permease n=1 Tax=Pendulispora albinea TaxID=2741071 RepID=A0ABZ2M657_9BACT
MIAQGSSLGSVAAPAAPSASRAEDRRGRIALVVAGLVVVLALVVLASLLLGEGRLSDAGLRSTLLVLRASRLVGALLVGSALAVSGLMIQGLFRNPLADASVIGTSAGALLGGNTTVLVFELWLAGRGLYGVPADVVQPMGCLLGALLALSIILGLLRRTGDVLSVILTGFLLSSLFLSLGSLVTSLAQERWELGRAVVAFSFGGLNATGPRHIALAAPLVVVGVGAAWFWAKPLDLLLCGDEEAASLGVNVIEVRRCCVLWIAVLTAGAVSLGGNLAFVGLLVPHALRPILGVDHRRLLPVAALTGAVFVAACDVLVRAIPSRSEIPLGVVTGMLGAPAFFALLVRMQKEGTNG